MEGYDPRGCDADGCDPRGCEAAGLYVGRIVLWPCDGRPGVLIKAFGLVIANSSISKREEHLVTFQNTVAKTQIDYLLLMRYNRGLCKDCKVIQGEILATQHRLIVMDVGIMLRRRKRSARERPRIGWEALTKDKAQELEGWLSALGAWRNSGNTSTMSLVTADYIREVGREVFGVSSGVSGGHKGDWWWNEVVQGKVEAKKAAYL
ncbi:uncharacterized protein [Nicotiana sylvestris]|uniref:uncharacterized protein n=1 Tax=Nicotiana sylvestris TaxID=4096 RepID=UPI00388C75EB